MSAETYLAQFGVTVAQAREFIISNVNNPATIFSVADQFGVSTDMLAEIVGGGFTGDDVSAWFAARGFDATQLDDAGSGTGGELLPDDMAALASLVTLNTNTGALSNVELRTAVIAAIGHDGFNQNDYWDAFDPSSYEGYSDGTFTADELGVPGFGNIAATAENLESLFYGTTIKALRAIDMQEILDIQSFVTANAAALESGNEVVLNQYIDLMVSVFQDQAVTPVISDAVMDDTIVMATSMFVELVASGDAPALFDGMLTGFMPG